MEKDLVFLHSSGKVLYRQWRGEDVSTTHGELKRGDIEKRGLVETSKGEKYLVLEPLVRDRVQGMPKGARPVYEYDAGFIAMLLSVEPGMRVLECGTGSGCVTLVFANIVGEKGLVHTLEKRERFFENAKENFKRAGVENIRAENVDLFDAKLGEYDAVFLDMGEPAKALSVVAEHLERGHYAAVFTPNKNEVREIEKAFSENGFVSVQSIFLDTKKMDGSYFSYPAYVIVGRRFG